MKPRPNRGAAANARPGLDPRLRNITASLDRLTKRVADRGLVATPDMSMKDIITHCGTKAAAGELNVFLSEGTWSFYEGFTLARGQVYFWGVPGATVFERHIDNSEPLLTVSGREVGLFGIRFDDAEEDTEATIKVTGSRCEIKDCVFDDCYRAIDVSGGNAQRIDGNRVIACRDTSYAIKVMNASTDGIMSNNTIEQASLTADIFFEDATLRWAVVGNQTLNGTISHRGADAHSVAGNPGTVTSR